MQKSGSMLKNSIIKGRNAPLWRRSWINWRENMIKWREWNKSTKMRQNWKNTKITIWLKNWNQLQVYGLIWTIWVEILALMRKKLTSTLWLNILWDKENKNLRKLSTQWTFKRKKKRKCSLPKTMKSKTPDFQAMPQIA